jgi:DNA topoisomerase III
MKYNGLGSAATRAGVIQRLISSEYIVRQKKALVPTPKGIALIEQVHPQLKDSVMTAEWKKRLKENRGSNRRALELRTRYRMLRQA